MEAAENIGCRDEGASIERQLGEGNDGDADAHKDGQAFGEARAPDDVGSDGLSDTITEHEDANDGEAGV